MILRGYRISRENSAGGVITGFCAVCAEKLLTHTELGLFSLRKIGTLHSYYYIGEKRGFFAPVKVAIARRVLHWE